MSPRGVRHLTAKFPFICRYCGGEFLGKMPTAQICHGDVCRRQYEIDLAKIKKANKQAKLLRQKQEAEAQQEQKQQEQSA